jgi:hypothetical protein
MPGEPTSAALMSPCSRSPCSPNFTGAAVSLTLAENAAALVVPYRASQGAIGPTSASVSNPNFGVAGETSTAPTSGLPSARGLPSMSLVT